jgi:hypothetical protein
LGGGRFTRPNKGDCARKYDSRILRVSLLILVIFFTLRLLNSTVCF